MSDADPRPEPASPDEQNQPTHGAPLPDVGDVPSVENATRAVEDTSGAAPVDEDTSGADGTPAEGNAEDETGPAGAGPGRVVDARHKAGSPRRGRPSRRPLQRLTGLSGGVAPLVESVAPAAGAAFAPLVRSARRRMRQARHRWRQRPGARRRRLRRIARQPLPNLLELYPEVRRAAPRELGLETLDVSSIRGTAVEGPAQRGRDFLPLPPFRSTNWSGRWQRIRGAVRRLESLPPIDVVKWDDGYWVLDGHNRVAAALYEDQVAIDAVVVEYVMPGARRPPAAHEIAPVLEESFLLRSAGQRRPAEEADGGRPAVDETGTSPITDGRPGDQARARDRADQNLPPREGTGHDPSSRRGVGQGPRSQDETRR